MINYYTYYAKVWNNAICWLLLLSEASEDTRIKSSATVQTGL